MRPYLNALRPTATFSKQCRVLLVNNEVHDGNDFLRIPEQLLVQTSGVVESFQVLAVNIDVKCLCDACRQCEAKLDGAGMYVHNHETL